MKKRFAEITLKPDPAFIEPFVGRWTNSRLGDIQILRNGSDFVLDAGEWKGVVGEHKDQSGARKLILTGPPLAGLTFWPQNNDGKPGLLLETAQQKYWFERSPRPCSAVSYEYGGRRATTAAVD